LNDAWRFNWADPPEPALEEALEVAERAVQLDPTDARGHAAVGNALLYLRRYDESLTAYERAVRYNPNDADILAEMGHSVCVNDDPDRAIGLINKAMSLNPHYPDWYLWHMGEAYFDKCLYQQAIEILNRMGDRTEAYRMLAASHALLGQQKQAEAAAKNILRSHPEFSLDHWANVPPDKNPEPRQRLMTGLRMAGLQ
jgi:tetratricopeptide (TPR) repeat protein